MLPQPPGVSSSLPSRPCAQPCGHRPGLEEGVQGHPPLDTCSGEGHGLRGHVRWRDPHPIFEIQSPGSVGQGFRAVEGTRLV